MKKFILLALLATTSIPSYAFFQCDMNYTAEGVDVKALVQLEGTGDKKLIIIREASTKEGENQGLIAAFRYTSVEKTRIGQIVHGAINADGINMPVSVVLPEVFPGAGKLILGDDSDSSTESLTNCRRKQEVNTSKR
jgi:hypothetical protein